MGSGECCMIRGVGVLLRCGMTWEAGLRGPREDMVVERIEQTLEGKLRKIRRYRMDTNSE